MDKQHPIYCRLGLIHSCSRATRSLKLHARLHGNMGHYKQGFKMIEGDFI